MPDPMDGSELDRAREVSALLFGAKHRLPIAIELGRGPAKDVYAAKLAPRVKASETQVGAELKRLAAAGLLEQREPASGVPGRPPLPYRRRASPYWKLAAELGRKPPQ